MRIAEKIKQFRRQLILIFVFALFSSLFVWIIFDDVRKRPFDGPLSWILIFVPVLFFFVRQRARKAYGEIEFALGFALTTYAVKSSLKDVNSIIDLDLQRAVRDLSWASLISGIYFMVRALDNIGKVLKKDKYRIEDRNKCIDQNWQKLVEGEAHRLWVQKGCRPNTQVADWRQAERNVARKKKDLAFFNFWEKVFGWD